ncbi:unnamed protein product [Nippostrongylus brasiliensis]|uniref:RNA-binding (RRM/RBD/RNP motifs) family protein n=1 Tax=Nippostrongylus brasiliensis TaxID=27835 RepID=A0A0N4XWX3_NIPBR|nr:unnamed protein product [Nippostrongylus brasiliensis]
MGCSPLSICVIAYLVKQAPSSHPFSLHTQQLCGSLRGDEKLLSVKLRLKEEEKALSAKHGAYMMNNYYDKGAMVPYGYNTYAGYGSYPYGYGGQYNNGYYGYMTYGR